MALLRCLFIVSLVVTLFSVQCDFMPLMSNAEMIQYMKMMDQLVQMMTKQKKTVAGFGRYDLCKDSKDGYIHFAEKLKTTLCNASDEFIFRLITRLCEEKGDALDEWVSEVFDLNKDGIISDFEKHV